MIEIEKLVRQRSLSLLFTACAFVLWQGGMTLSEFSDEAGKMHGIGNGLTVAGSVAWVAAMVFFVHFQYKVKKARAGCVLNDEWSRNMRLQAIALGSFITFITIALSYIAISFVQVPVRGIVHLIFVVAIAAPLFSYVVMEFKTNINMRQV